MDVPPSNVFFFFPSNVLMDVFPCFVCYYKGWCSKHPSSDMNYLLVQMLLLDLLGQTLCALCILMVTVKLPPVVFESACLLIVSNAVSVTLLILCQTNR